MSLQYTLAILKPDVVRRQQIGEALKMIESQGLSLVALQMRQWSYQDAEAFYHEHIGATYYPPLVTFMTSGPLVLAALKGPDAVACYRKLLGPTDPSKASSGDLRFELGDRLMPANAAHGSDSEASAHAELKLCFGQAMCQSWGLSN